MAARLCALLLKAASSASDTLPLCSSRKPATRSSTRRATCLSAALARIAGVTHRVPAFLPPGNFVPSAVVRSTYRRRYLSAETAKSHPHRRGLSQGACYRCNRCNRTRHIGLRAWRILPSLSGREFAPLIRHHPDTRNRPRHGVHGQGTQSFGRETNMLIGVALILATGIAWLRLIGNEAILILKTSSGDVRALRSINRQLVYSAKQTIEQAISERR